jgi:hypothetical protein
MGANKITLESLAAKLDKLLRIANNAEKQLEMIPSNFNTINTTPKTAEFPKTSTDQATKLLVSYIHPQKHSGSANRVSTNCHNSTASAIILKSPRQRLTPDVITRHRIKIGTHFKKLQQKHTRARKLHFFGGYQHRRKRDLLGLFPDGDDRKLLLLYDVYNTNNIPHRWVT